MPAHPLSARITLLSESNRAIVHLINRLAKLPLQPGSLPLDSDGADARRELTDEIRENLRQLEDDFDLLKQDVDDIEANSAAPNRRAEPQHEREGARLSIQVVRLGEDLKHARSHFRQAQLQAKRTAALAKQKERELLFADIQEGRSTPTSSRRGVQDRQSKDDAEIHASNDVNASLRRMLQSMSGALEQSASAQDILVQDQARLGQLSEHYSFTNDLLSSSRTLLSSLVTSQKSDTWYLETAFWLLVTTISWLIFRRFLYGPLWWLVWLPVKIWFRALYSVLGVFGLAKSSSSIVSAGHSPTSTLIVHSSATERPPSFEAMGGPGPHIPVGHGGPGRTMEDASRQGSVSQQVGQMAEASQQPKKQDEAKTKEEPKVAGDGQVLVDSKEPKNPKKRMFDTEMEAQKEADRQRDEL